MIAHLVEGEGSREEGGRGCGGGGQVVRHEKGIPFPLSIQVRGEGRVEPGWSGSMKETS
jgi:hypothetical protein